MHGTIWTNNALQALRQEATETAASPSLSSPCRGLQGIRTRKSLTPIRELCWGMYLWANFNLKMAWDGERTREGMHWASELFFLKIVHCTKRSLSSSWFSALCQACRAGSQTTCEQKKSVQLLFPKLNLNSYFYVWVWNEIGSRPKNYSLNWIQTASNLKKKIMTWSDSLIFKASMANHIVGRTLSLFLVWGISKQAVLGQHQLMFLPGISCLASTVLRPW